MVSFATPAFPEKSELLFGADSDADESYQMVPVREFRQVAIPATPRRFVVSSMNSQIALLFDKNRRTPIPNNRLVVQGSTGLSDTEFSIFGETSGRTQIVIFGDGGVPESRMVVSVKRPRFVTCGYFFLTDKLTKKPEGIEGLIRDASERIKALYLDQANIIIDNATTRELIIADFNLSTLEKRGDKQVKIIYLDFPFAGVPNTLDIESFLHDQVNGRGGGQNRVNVVAAWDLEYTPEKARTFPINGSTLVNRPPPNVCLVEVFPASEDNVCVWAHEIGHALGLDHQTTDGFLMSKVKGDSWRLRQAEIDHVNPSGTTF